MSCRIPGFFSVHTLFALVLASLLSVGCTETAQKQKTSAAAPRQAAPAAPKPSPDAVADTALAKPASTPAQETPRAQDASAAAQPGAEVARRSAPADLNVIVFRLEPRQGVMGSLVDYYKPVRIALSTEPQEELAAKPKFVSEKPLYGAMRLGEGPDDLVSIALDEPEGQPPRIYVDRNNDEDLTNDGSGEWTRSGDTLGLSDVAIDVPYAAGSIPYTLEFYRFTTRLQQFVLYYRNACREGEIASGDQRYKIAVLDENADGRFDDLDQGSLIIDLNQDGQLVGNPDSAEHHRLDQPFNIHGKVWEVASLSPDGRELRLRPSEAVVEMQRYLDPGYPAPLFTGKGLDDQPIDLAAAGKGAKYVLLDFWASWCGPCRGEFPYLRRLHARYKDHGLRIVGINLDSDREAATRAASENRLDYPHVFDGGGWQNAVAVLYRVHGIPQTYLLDKDLNIVAADLRGAMLEQKMLELLGPGDEAAAAAVEASMSGEKPAPEERPAAEEKPSAEAK